MMIAGSGLDHGRGVIERVQADERMAGETSDQGVIEGLAETVEQREEPDEQQRAPGL